MKLGKLKNLFLGLVCFVWFFSVVGCSTGYPVKTYEGSFLPEDRVGILRVPEDITIVSIDGAEVTNYLMDNLAVSYHILPGEHDIVFKYSGLWSTARISSDEDSARAKLIESGLLGARLSVEAGKIYQFKYDSPKSRSEAEAAVASFTADVIEGVNIVAKSSPYDVSSAAAKKSITAVGAVAVEGAAKMNTPVKGGEPFTDEPGLKAVKPKPVAPKVSVDELSRLEGMKSLWEGASAEEKKAFLKWAFQ